MATKPELEAEVENLQNELRKLQAQTPATDSDSAPMLKEETLAELRAALAEFREVEKAPASTDRTGLLSVAGQTLANRVEGIIS